MWSSWACVSTSASTSSSRSRIAVKSGRIRSTPGCDSSGNSTPQSMSSSRPAYSTTAMLRPISPRPPSAKTRRPFGASGGGVPRSGCGWLMRRAPRRGMPRSMPAASQSRRSWAISASVASTSGSRTGPAGSPASVQRGLRQDHSLGAEEAGAGPAGAAGGGRARRRRPRRRTTRSCAAICGPATCVGTPTTPTAPSESSGSVSTSSPE